MWWLWMLSDNKTKIAIQTFDVQCIKIKTGDHEVAGLV